MVRSAWVKPMTLVQKFEANEAVAAGACWDVICKSDGDKWWGSIESIAGYTDNSPHDLWKGKERFSVTARSYDHVDCQNALNTSFNFDVANGTITFVGVKGDGEGTTGAVDDWYDNDPVGLSIGDEVYWYTTKGNDRWNHWGYITAVDETNPNRS